MITYGVQDFENRYDAYVDISSGTIRIRRKVNSVIETLAEQTGLSLSTDTWYELEVDWGVDGTHVLTIYDTSGSQLGQVSVSDERTWTTGRIGYNAHTGNGASGYFDYVTIKRTRLVGEFEDGFDSWLADSNVQISRANGDDQPASVTQGEHALEVTVNSEPEPTLKNEVCIQQADLSNHPYLQADVLPSSIEGSNSAVTFRFRYHHTNPGGVEESPEMTVSQKYGGRIAWDMSGLSATKLNSPDTLEIAWYPEDHPPASGFDYNGTVYVDNVRLTDDHDPGALARSIAKRRELERAHGIRVDRIVQSETSTVQDGVYEYDDGTQISYSVESLPSGALELTIDGESFTFEVGAQ